MIQFTRTSKNKSGTTNVHYTIVKKNDEVIKGKRVFKNITDDTIYLLNRIANCINKENYNKYYIECLEDLHKEYTDFILKILLSNKVIPDFVIEKEMFEMTPIEKPSTKKYNIMYEGAYKRLELALERMTDKELFEETLKFQTLIYSDNSKFSDIIERFVITTIKDNNKNARISEKMLGHIKAAIKTKLIYLNERGIDTIYSVKDLALYKKKKIFTEMAFESPVNIYNLALYVIEFCLKDTIYVNPNIIDGE